ncbi:hypothetical protein MAC_04949 [Metarhizium acridum CQMa 102]|uniref:Hypervirulence associated protein TUDOR domain-containing protein n=1 Tax=Metarhizium acridum (strain CQMa 102) TaxID=655827 RepID=E9E501_METAQ|nr:uncharacterized protein MAC_04949 [Metarhizium acridum CQMa 102]EFY89018.1 hypothetical protein MAC_04949 [Metarhizium acridum CQMa 102]
MPRDLKDKASKAIREGDQVWTPVRGGKHQGPVGGVVRTEEEAQETGTKNPPKPHCQHLHQDTKKYRS